MGLSYLRREGRPAAKRRGSKVGSGAASQAGGLRTLALEQVEGRVMLTHAAPVLNAGAPVFASIAENIPLASNTGSTVSAMLASGGAGFLTLDTANGALEGIAVVGETGDANGLWQYSTNGGSSWTTLNPAVSAASALVLRGADKLRFLPDAGFSGTVQLQFHAWDQTDAAAAGSQQDLTLLGATGGSTAYSSASASASLAVTPTDVAPSFILMPSTTTLENNTVTASGGLPGGSNPNVISVLNFASSIVPGSGGSSSVSFSVTDVNGNFSTLFAQAPAIDSQGTLTYKLKPDVAGTATLSVTASNGALVSASHQATLTITAINDPPTLDPISNPAPVLDTASQQTISLTGITAGLNESQALTVSVAPASGYPGDNAALLANKLCTYSSPNSTGTLTYTPAVGQNGTLHLTVTVTDNGGTASGGVNTFTRTFVVTVQSLPSFTVGPNERVVQNSAESFANWATITDPGFPGTNGQLSFQIQGNSNPSLFSVAPSISSSGTLSFTPTAGAYGVATITAALYNSATNRTSSPQNFTIAVVAPPTTRWETYEVNYTGASAMSAATGLLANDSDPNSGGGAVMTPTVTSPPAYGTLSVNADGSFTYTAGGSFQGVDHFSYKAVDGPANGNIVTDTVYSHEGALVNKLYQEALGRPAEDTAITYYASRLHNSQLTMDGAGGVAHNVLTGTEHVNLVINAIYQAFLGRAADASGLAYFSNMWLVNGGQDQVIAAIAVTDECYSHAGGTNTAWVTLLYNQILHRAPDSGGLNYFVTALNNATMSRQQVVQTLIGTAEYRNVVITGFYTTYLYRSPITSELTYWTGQLQSGVTQLAIQENFTGTPEYAGNPPAPAAGSAYRWTVQ